MAPWLVEKTRDLLLSAVEAEIAGQLSAVRNDRLDKKVSTEPPHSNSYFIYPMAHTYNCPAIFAIVDSAEVPDDRTGENHVNAEVKIYFSAVVEDREQELCTIKCERYTAALFQILQRRTITDTPDNVKIYSRVVRFTFSPMFTKERKTDNMAVFRKEIELELLVKHFENPTS